jgi:hypothetical protein
MNGSAMLNGPLVTAVWPVLGLPMNEPPGAEGRVGIQLMGFGRGAKSSVQ